MSEEKEIDEMTKNVEMVDIGGDEFSMDVLASMFSKSQENVEISVAEYILGYKELYKFLCLMGTVFGWVGSDVYNKVNYKTHSKAFFCLNSLVDQLSLHITTSD